MQSDLPTDIGFPQRGYFSQWASSTDPQAPPKSKGFLHRSPSGRVELKVFSVYPNNKVKGKPSLERIASTCGRLIVSKGAEEPLALGTAFKIGDKSVITAAHLFPDDISPNTRIYFYCGTPATVGVGRDIQLSKYAENKNLYLLEVVSIHRDDLDVAFLRLADLGKEKLFSAVPYAIPLRHQTSETDCYVIGFPALPTQSSIDPASLNAFQAAVEDFKGGNAKVVSTGKLLNPNSNFILHTCSTFGGMSGGPFVVEPVNGLYFSGVHLAASEDSSHNICVSTSTRTFFDAYNSAMKHDAAYQDLGEYLGN